MGGGATRERGRPDRMLSRFVPLSFPAMRTRPPCRRERNLPETNEKRVIHEGPRRDTKRDGSATSTRLWPGNPARALWWASSHDPCWLITGSKSSVGKFLIHIDAQDAQDIQDSFQETASLSWRESAKPHRIIA